MTFKKSITLFTAALTLMATLFSGGCTGISSPYPFRLNERFKTKPAEPNNKPDKYAVLIGGGASAIIDSG